MKKETRLQTPRAKAGHAATAVAMAALLATGPAGVGPAWAEEAGDDPAQVPAVADRGAAEPAGRLTLENGSNEEATEMGAAAPATDAADEGQLREGAEEVLPTAPAEEGEVSDEPTEAPAAEAAAVASSEDDAAASEATPSEAAPAAVGLDIAATFPDTAIRQAVSTRDVDGDGFLSDVEAASIFALVLHGKTISSFEGLQHLSGLSQFSLYDCNVLGGSLALPSLPSLDRLVATNSHLASIDVSGCPNLTYLDVGGNGLTSIDLTSNAKLEDFEFSGNSFSELDFRQNGVLRVAYHAVNGEKVYISAGMTDYIGCDMVPSHTGNLIVDLAGFYTVQPDGTKTVDLHQVMSQALIDQITESSERYDPATGTLTIPAAEGTTVIAASDGNVYTFYTELGQTSAHDVTYVSQGETYSFERVADGERTTAPAGPEREGFRFSGWFLDEACTSPFDFATPITADIVLYAGWAEEAAPAPTPDPEPDPAPKPDPAPAPELERAPASKPEAPAVPKPLPTAREGGKAALAATGDASTAANAIAAAALAAAGALGAVGAKARGKRARR